MHKMGKILTILSVVCLSVLLVAGAAMAKPQWKEPQLKVNSGAKGINVKAKGLVKVQFNDVRGHWAEQNIVLINAGGVIKGYGNNTFQPNKPVTKEEAITMIVRMMNGDVTGNALLSGKFRNSSVSSWSSSFLNKAVEEKILSEVELNTMAFNKPAQRYEVAVWLVRALDMEDEAIENAGADLDFKDEAAIPAWARGYVKVATDEGIITGFPGNVFRPGSPITRAEMATMLVRAGEDMETPSPMGFSFIRGIIESLDGDSITISKTGKSSGEVTVDLADELIVYLDGKSAELEDLDEGDTASLLLNGDREAIVVIARDNGDSDEDEDEDESDDQSAEGTVESISSSSITVKVGSQLKVYALDDDVEVEVNGEDADLDDVKKGHEVELTLEDDKVIRIEAESVEVEVSGTLESVGDDSITVEVDNALKVYQLSDDVDITLDGEDAELDELEKGYTVEIIVVDGEVTAIEADSGTISGELESVGDSSITVKVDGDLEVYSLADDVEVIIDGDEEELDELERGYEVDLTFDDDEVVRIEASSADVEID